MIESADEIEAKKKIRNETINNLNWTPQEKLFRQKPKFRSKTLKGYQVPISKAILIKFKRSCFGTYLDSFNCKQHQDKFLNDNKLNITKWDIKNFTSVEMNIFNENNNASDNLFSLLIKAVKETDCITWSFLYSHLCTLRMVDFHITVLDKDLLNFKNLQVLVISNNWVTDIHGKYLPRKLQFLESYANEVSNLENLCKNPPGNLLHIGLGRNKLTDGK
ncbi:hypothetical protein ILUMI_18200 [Ignelater luminosus]|uniref:Uncharacterized protein n=1 Tax=Ignelater luminosus TaxID=2038154 RepID=A0A8K0CP24_IGNLU|nr:hypothetical protein ILUMI_18200 [Ignelater luminosus]